MDGLRVRSTEIPPLPRREGQIMTDRVILRDFVESRRCSTPARRSIKPSATAEWAPLTGDRAQWTGSSPERKRDNVADSRACVPIAAVITQRLSLSSSTWSSRDVSTWAM